MLSGIRLRSADYLGVRPHVIFVERWTWLSEICSQIKCKSAAFECTLWHGRKSYHWILHAFEETLVYQDASDGRKMKQPVVTDLQTNCLIVQFLKQLTLMKRFIQNLRGSKHLLPECGDCCFLGEYFYGKELAMTVTKKTITAAAILEGCLLKS